MKTRTRKRRKGDETRLTIRKSGERSHLVYAGGATKRFPQKRRTLSPARGFVREAALERATVHYSSLCVVFEIGEIGGGRRRSEARRTARASRVCSRRPHRLILLGRFPEPLRRFRHALAARVEREEAGEGDARDAEEAHPRGGRRLRGDVVRDDLGRRERTTEAGPGETGENRIQGSESTKPAIFEGRVEGARIARRLARTHEVEGDVRVHGEGDAEGEVDGGKPAGDDHRRRHQTCDGRGGGGTAARSGPRRRATCRARVLARGRGGRRARADARRRTGEGDPRRVVDLHHRRAAVGCAG